jgi:hypothetical protein
VFPGAGRGRDRTRRFAKSPGSIRAELPVQVFPPGRQSWALPDNGEAAAGPGSSVVERFLGKEEVAGSIPALGSTDLRITARLDISGIAIFGIVPNDHLTGRYEVPDPILNVLGSCSSPTRKALDWTQVSMHHCRPFEHTLGASDDGSLEGGSKAGRGGLGRRPPSRHASHNGRKASPPRVKGGLKWVESLL